MTNFLAKINWIAIAYGMVLTALLSVSCNSTGLPTPDPTRPIDNSIRTTDEVAKGMGNVADNIDRHVGEVRKATPDPLIPKLGPYLDGINLETGTLREIRGKLDMVQGELEQAKKDVKSIQDSNVKQGSKIAKLEKEKESALNKLMVWVILLSIVGVGVSGALVYTGKTWGISIGFGCLVTLGLAIFITKYSMWFAIVAAGLCVLGVGYVIWEMVSRKKIGTELVQTIEANKMAMRAPARLHLFGNAAIPGHVDIIQSAATKDFVKKLRSKKTVRLAPSAFPVNLHGTDNKD